MTRERRLLIKRGTIVLTTVSLFGCTLSPLRLLVHNETPRGQTVLVRFPTRNGGDVERRTFLPSGEAKFVDLWREGDGGSWFDFDWNGHRQRTLTRDYSRTTYHAFVGEKRVRFERASRIDDLREAGMALLGIVLFCVLSIGIMVVPILLFRKRRR